MAQNNKVILVGNLGKDAKLVAMKEGEFVVFSLCTQDSYKKDGEWIEKKPVWHEIKVFAPYLLKDAKELKKGERVEVIGELSYIQKEGVPFPQASINAIKIDEAVLPKPNQEELEPPAESAT